MPEPMSDTVCHLDRNGSIRLDPSACIFCNMCYNTCNQQGLHVYTKADRATKTPPRVRFRSDDVSEFQGKTHISTEGEIARLEVSNCIACGQCALACPTSAITVDETDFSIAKRLLEARHDPSQLKNCARPEMKITIALVAPASRVGIAECAGLPAGTTAIMSLVKGLRAAGFDYVFDVNVGADSTTIIDLEEFNEARKLSTPENPRVTFTSCCPAWVRYAQLHCMDILPSISTARSCVAMLAALLRRVFCHEKGLRPEELGIVSVMPCSAKKVERRRPGLSGEADGEYQGPDVDASITVVEAYELIQGTDVTIEPDPTAYDSCEPLESPFDTWAGICSGSAHAFGRSCGVAEAVMDQLCHEEKCADDCLMVPVYTELPLILGDGEKPAPGHILKETRICVDGKEYIIGIAAGGQAIRTMLHMLKEDPARFQFCEVMACPFGCIGGAGMPKPKGAKQSAMKGRKDGLQSLVMSSSCLAASSCPIVDPLIDAGRRTNSLHIQQNPL